MKNWLPVLLVLLVLGSCTIEKRLYNKGFYVEFRKNPGKSAENPSTKKPEKADVSVEEQQTVLLPEPAQEMKELAANTRSNVPVSASEPTVVTENKVTQKQFRVLTKQSGMPVPGKQLAIQKPSVNTVKKVAAQEQSQHSKPREKQRVELSYEAIEALLDAGVVIILVFSWAYPTFWLVVQAVVAFILLAITVFCIVWFIVWLCTGDFGNFPWFWSGR